MKRFLFFSALVSAVALLSCSKQGDHGYHGSRSVTIDTTIASGTQYVLDLKTYGDADDVAAIKTQAANYTTSEIINTGSGFSAVYHFSAIADVKNPTTQQVVISVTEGNHGQSRPCKDSTLITINFKVQ
ncbi:hypothetical protein [Flavisolibacter ginsenosidimutans]|uniref:Lipoprotein n=1 Tax=Flavisolibacter ginsenosidimutans TaxID=661481 RepID=A0A5B8UEG9_9BACT|nr:hypothetical protein [Flavisolibacter ginsenosidimutans]QEC54706.1 hypothetical protein FSB75_01920 [Flavisolibacter ginsenosidimutans]